MSSTKTTKVTACLICYKKRNNIGTIVDHLRKYDFISEILIRDQGKTENLKSYGRYVLAEKAENDIFYLQDDDMLNHSMDKLWEAFNKPHKGIVHGGTQPYIDDMHNHTYGDVQSCMAGWGSFGEKSWIKEFKRYTDKYGYDYVFKREADRIMGTLLKTKHTPILCDIEHLAGFDDDEVAMSSQEDHLEMREKAIGRALLV